MIDPELDSILTTCGNPTRRRIIKRLSQEPSYPLQLSKELGIGQPLVAKHLGAMENAGVVTCSLESSPHGPRRREYLLNKSVSVTLDFAPHFFSTRVLSFGTLREDLENSEDSSYLMRKVDEILQHPVSVSRICLYEMLLADIDRKLEELQDKRAALLYIRNYVMKKATKLIVDTQRTCDEKKVLYHVLDEHNRDVQRISERLNLRESVVREILESLKQAL